MMSVSTTWQCQYFIKNPCARQNGRGIKRPIIALKFEILLLALTILISASACDNNPSSSNSNASSKTDVDQKFDQNAISLVGKAIEQNKFNVTAKDLATKKNPKGEGTFVFVPQTNFSGVERYIIWMVVESKAYALNSPSKMVTPSLPWPREGDDAIWTTTGIDKFSGASEAIKIIFESQAEHKNSLS